MKKYLVVLEGKNCVVRNMDKMKNYGFFASRYVEASDPEAAQNIVMQMVKDELHSQGLVENTPTDPLTIVVDEIRCVASFDSSISTKGFTFYVDDVVN